MTHLTATRLAREPRLRVQNRSHMNSISTGPRQRLPPQCRSTTIINPRLNHNVMLPSATQRLQAQARVQPRPQSVRFRPELYGHAKQSRYPKRHRQSRPKDREVELRRVPSTRCWPQFARSERFPPISLIRRICRHRRRNDQRVPLNHRRPVRRSRRLPPLRIQARFDLLTTIFSDKADKDMQLSAAVPRRLNICRCHLHHHAVGTPDHHVHRFRDCHRRIQARAHLQPQHPHRLLQCPGHKRAPMALTCAWTVPPTTRVPTATPVPRRPRYHRNGARLLRWVRNAPVPHLLGHHCPPKRLNVSARQNYHLAKWWRTFRAACAFPHRRWSKCALLVPR